jgi:hypothetical protein
MRLTVAVDDREDAANKDPCSTTRIKANNKTVQVTTDDMPKSGLER